MSTTSISLARALPVISLAVFMSGCEAIGAIFKTGFWAGAIGVLIIVGIIGFIISRVRA